MCLCYCHNRNILFDSDENDVCGDCVHNTARGRNCASCMHAAGNICQMSRAALPTRRWCCHHDVTPRRGWRALTNRDLRGCLRFNGLAAVLGLYDAEYRESGGAVLVNLDALAIPLIYGVPVSHWPDAVLETEYLEKVPLADGLFALKL